MAATVREIEVENKTIQPILIDPSIYMFYLNKMKIIEGKVVTKKNM